MLPGVSPAGVDAIPSRRVDGVKDSWYAIDATRPSRRVASMAWGPGAVAGESVPTRTPSTRLVEAATGTSLPLELQRRHPPLEQRQAGRIFQDLDVHAPVPQPLRAVARDPGRRV